MVEKGGLYSYELRREGGEDVLYFNYSGAPFIASISDSPIVMERVIDALIENSNVSRVVLMQDSNYNYDFNETSMLLEIAQLYTFLLKQERVLSQAKLTTTLPQMFTLRYNEVFSFIYLLKKDPIGAYFELKRALFKARSELERFDETTRSDQNNYIYLLEKILKIFEQTKIIKKSEAFIDSYKRGNREIYSKLFIADILPSFSFSRLVLDVPSDAEVVDQYEISGKEFDKSLVTIFRRKDEAKLIYQLNPPENSLNESQLQLLTIARGVLLEHQPQAEEFVDTARVRQVFFNISKDLLQDLANNRGISVNYSEINKLATILVRHTIGFGLVEVLLQDEKLQDIVLNSPISMTNIFARHQDYDECIVNILPSQQDADSWAAKFRLISGRPLDEANPILDTQLEVDKNKARVSVIQQPLSPDGLAYALRRHRDSPWTLSLFVKNKMINPFTAGLYSFLIDGSRTILVAGTRSSGKTSLLSSFLLEILPKYRIIVIEDSLELPVEFLRKINYDILRMKVRSALLKTTNEVSADDGIRTSLRLGDSSLIIGEVRSVEAKALYEAMRVGALANVVAGTIHGASPYAVFDRVVNDLEVPATSFKATDIITVANPIKTPDGLKSWRRVLQVSEVRKHWKRDPLEEKGFVDLVKYNVEKDELEPTEDLINGDSEIIKDIAGNVKGWAGNWDAVYDNILLRAKIKKELVSVSEKTGNKEILEASFNSTSNTAFHKISEKIKDEVGLPISDRVFPDWQKWLNSQIKLKKI